jgi:glucose-1-phosphate thymidylyltransferase
LHAIIPAAGIGTRLRPQTWSVPKPLLEVAGKPILAHIMDDLTVSGVDHVTLIVGYLGNEVVAWAKKSYPSLSIDFAVQENMDGLASAVSLAEPFTSDARTLVVLGDTLFTADLRGATSVPMNMLAVMEVDDPSRFGVVLMDGDRVSRLIEKPSESVSRLAIVGVYSFLSGSVLMDAVRRLIASGRKTRGEFQLTDAMQLMLTEGHPFGVFPVSGWFDCGRPETFLETNRALLDRSGGEVLGDISRAVLIPPVSIGAGAVVVDSVIGPHVSVGSGATVTGSVIADSVIGPGARIHGALLRASIIGSGASISGAPSSISVGSTAEIRL